jgi:hypothetical protein
MNGPSPISGLLATGDWMMTPGERATLAGVVCMLKPSLSIEIGTHKGGSLEQISAHIGTVHSFDLVRHREVTEERFPNVTFHIGDSHELLPEFLEQLAESGANVDFVFVDGDHSAPGVQRDVEDLLSSSSVRKTIILLHDTLNERVRAGLEQIDYGASDGVRFVDLDFVQGKVMSEGPQKNELWYGLGLVVTGWDLAGDQPWPPAYSASDVYASFATALAEGESISRPGYGQLRELEEHLAAQRELVKLMERSWSWRLTAPVRSVAQFVRRHAPSGRPTP